MFYQIFLLPQEKRNMIISNKHAIYELPQKLLSHLKLKILGKDTPQHFRRLGEPLCPHKKKKLKILGKEN